MQAWGQNFTPDVAKGPDLARATSGYNVANLKMEHRAFPAIQSLKAPQH